VSAARVTGHRADRPLARFVFVTDFTQHKTCSRDNTPRRDAAEGLVLNDLRKFLKKSIRALPLLQREAVELAFFDGLSHREIAAATRAPLGTVKTRLELGLQKLTHALRPLRHKV